MPSRTPITPRDCNIARALNVVGDRWTLLIMREVLYYDQHRFEDFVQYTGASRDIIADRLKKLLAIGMLEQRPYNNAGSRHEYFAAAMGSDTRTIIESLGLFGEQHLARDLASETGTGTGS
jgi:DNA-binding HxlR family transcriptional regulator